MRSMILAVATCASLSFASLGAEAMPAGSVAGPAVAPAVTLVAGGCGPYMHPNFNGVCVPFRRAYRPVVVAPRVYVRPIARCGVRVGPLGVALPC